MPSPTPAWLFRLCLVLCLAVLGGGCATNFVYERADRLAQRWVGGYLPLDATQRARLENGLAELHAWHRREQLPDYAAWLRLAAQRLGEDSPAMPEELQAQGRELATFWGELSRAALPLLVEIGQDLDESQVQALLVRLREDQREERVAARGRTEAWHQQRRVRSMERFLRRWTGPLTAEQRTALQDWSAGLEPTREAAFANRAGWVDALEDALARRHDADALRTAAEILIVDPAARWDPEYDALVARNTAHTMAFMAEFLATLEPWQRQRAVERLERLSVQLDRLAGAGG